MKDRQNPVTLDPQDKLLPIKNLEDLIAALIGMRPNAKDLCGRDPGLHRFAMPFKSILLIMAKVRELKLSSTLPTPAKLVSTMAIGDWRNPVHTPEFPNVANTTSSMTPGF